MANDDAQTDLKKRARRRLVGAAALALFAVIVLPMIMDPEPKPVGDEIQVTIPDQDGGNFAARRLDAPPPAAPTPEPAPPVAVVAPPPAAPAVAETPPKPKASAPAAEPAPKAAPPVVSDAAERKRIEAILSGAPVDRPDAGGAEAGFIVQIGAFSKPEGAAALVKTVRGKGFEAFSRKIGSTTRVRVGPFETRSAAEKAAEKLSAQGFKGVVMPQG
ncbi:MAG: SPOR domain-containing protein [Rhodocyclaceae bacterium]|nr:SPOR domain-containing protein [Rhodocyclaceae bacterium]